MDRLTKFRELLRDGFLYHCAHLFLVFCFWVHFMFAWYFHSVGITFLFGLNCVSFLIYTLFIFVIRKSDDVIMMLTYLEIYAFSIISTNVMGYEADFYLYIIGMMFSAMIIFQKWKGGRVISQLLGAVAVVACVAMERIVVFPEASAQAAVGNIGLTVRIINVAITVWTIMYLSFAYTMQLEESRSKLTYAASHDELTGLYSRTYFSELVKNRRENQTDSFSVIMLDIDDFKCINDTYGHSIGDAALKYLAAKMNDAVRGDDAVIRWGGEEFVILLKNCPLEKAAEIAERIRKDTSETSYGEYADKKLFLTVTLGVACAEPDEELENAIKQADQHMYEGKQLGKNRVVWMLERV